MPQPDRASGHGGAGLTAKEQALLDALETPVVVVDRDGRIAAFNQAWCRFGPALGRSLGVASGVSYFDLLNGIIAEPLGGDSPGKARSVTKGIRSVLAGTLGQFSIEIPCHGQQSWRWFALTATPLVTAEAGAIITHNDVTAQKSAEFALSEVAECKRLLFEEAGCGVVLFDAELRCIEVNQGLADSLGRSREELLGMQVWEWDRQGPDREAYRARLPFPPQGPGQVETQFRHKDGTVLDVELSWQPARWLGQPVYFCRVRPRNACGLVAIRSQESEPRLPRCLDTPMIGIGLLHADSRWRDVNARFCELTGYSREELLQRRWADLVAGGDRPDFASLLAGTLRSQRLELQLRRQDGRIVDIDGSIGGLYGADDHRAAAILGFFLDSTDQKRMEQELRKLTLAVAQNPVPILITDIQSRIEYVNEAFERTTGYCRQEVIGRDPAFLQSGQTPSSTYAALWEALRAGRSFAGEFINRRKNGEIYVEYETVSPVRDETGRVTHYVAVKQDITEQRRLEAREREYRSELEKKVAERTAELQAANRALSQRAAEIRDLYENAPCGYHSLSPEGTVVAINATELALLGYRRDEVESMNYRDLVAPESRPSFDALRSLLATTGAVSNLELELLHKNGSRVPVVLNATAVRRADGSYRYDRTTVLDIRERRRHDQERAALERELADRAAAANAASEAKSAFLANVSHEIRTPVNAICMTLELLRLTALSERQTYYLDKVRVAADTLIRVIDEILDLSKIEAGRLELETVDFELEEVFEELAALMAGEAELKGLELVFELADGLPRRLSGDPFRLRQILTNLVGNAIKFSERGSILVSAALSQRSEQGAVLRFEVRDQGIGLAEGAKEALFGPFTQADTSTTRRFGGVGLGLAICRQLVESMQGEIGVESAVGEGSTFHFTARFGIPGDSSPSPIVGHGGGREALVIDPNAEVRRVLCAYLTRCGLPSQGFDALSPALARLHEPGRCPIILFADAAVLAAIPPATPAVTPVLLAGHTGLSGLETLATRVAVLVKPVTQGRLSRLLQELSTGVSGQSTPPEVVAGRATLMDWVDRLGAAEILVVEDAEVNRDLLAEILASHGLRVRLAENGLEALSEVAKRMPAAVLMDCQMPVMDGYEATRKLRQDSRYRSLPVIALTAHALSGDRERCLDAGMNDYLAKPVEVRDLLATLERWLKPRQALAGQGQAVAASFTLPQLPGVDQEAGLRRVNHKVELYVQLLRKFRETHLASFESEFRRAVQANDWPRAVRLAHTLKGTSRTLGVMGLGDLAQVLEAACREGDPTATGPALETLLQEMDRVAQGLASLTDG